MGWKKTLIAMLFIIISAFFLKLPNVFARISINQSSLKSRDILAQTPTPLATPTSTPMLSSTPGVSNTDLVEHFERVTEFTLKTISGVVALLGVVGLVAGFFNFKLMQETRQVISETEKAIQETRNAVKESREHMKTVEKRVQTLENDSNELMANLESQSVQLTKQFEKELHRLSEDIKVNMDTTRRLHHFQEARDPNPRFRLRALQQLANNPESEVVSLMVERLSLDEDSNVRAEAAFSLGNILKVGSWDSLTIQNVEVSLLRGIEDDNESVRYEAIQALKKIAYRGLPLSQSVYSEVWKIANDSTESEKIIQVAQEIIDYMET